ncbi:MAG TPA: hypothetical protein VG222_07840 [Vicinamibacterales bacterium]|jgi:hypothetical protein|nr:hypothetical protein [Vicinamibacterales bacterium]
MLDSQPAGIKPGAMQASVGPMAVFPERSSRTTSHWASICTYEGLLATLTLLIVTLGCALSPMQSDTWWQLRAGKDMWTSHLFLLKDLYSYTAYGAFWPNHEWLSEVIFYAIYVAGGPAGVTLFSTALIAGGWLIAWQLTKGPAFEKVLWVALALLPASFEWEPRPLAFSLLFLMASVFFLAREKYWPLPGLFVLWANCHGGVLLGFGVLFAGLSIQTVIAPQKWRKAILVLSGCLIATAVTPLGTSFLGEMAGSISRIHLYPLDEWRRTPIADVRVLPFWIIAIALCTTPYFVRHKLERVTVGDATLYTCALSLLPMAVLAIRNMGPFVMVAVPALTSAFQLRRDSLQSTRFERPLLNGAIMGSAALTVVAIVIWAYREEIPRLKWQPIAPAAIAAIERCPGNLYNRYDEGGYLIWFAPERKVFVDGRQDPYPSDFVLEHIRIETGKGDYHDVFARFAIHCAYLPVTSPTASGLARDGWKALYRDSSWVVLSEYEID